MGVTAPHRLRRVRVVAVAEAELQLVVRRPSRSSCRRASSVPRLQEAELTAGARGRAGDVVDAQVLGFVAVVLRVLKPKPRL